MITRREFVRNTALTTAGIGLVSASGFSNILGANDRVNIAILGCGGRAHSLAKAIGQSGNSKVTHICDVDKNRLDKFQGYVAITNGNSPIKEKDFRVLLENKDIDAVAVAKL